MRSTRRSNTHLPREGFIASRAARLYYREVGQGLPIILLHGGPDFDHSYLLPDMDCLSDSFWLIYYDQRGRGRSAKDVEPRDVSMESEVYDLENVRKHFGLESVALLGHSWGALLALEYAIRYPARLSHLILLNSAPIAHRDYLLLRKDRSEKTPADMEELKLLSRENAYHAGDPDVVADYYRVHFRATVRQRKHLDQVIMSLRSSFTQDGIIKARAIEKGLYDETWLLDDYDLAPRLKELDIPTLIIHGDYDFVPLECAVHIAQAMPNAQLVVLKDTGHFSYIETPDLVRVEIENLIQGAMTG